jgi:hypothetical protein
MLRIGDKPGQGFGLMEDRYLESENLRCRKCAGTLADSGIPHAKMLFSISVLADYPPP